MNSTQITKKKLLSEIEHLSNPNIIELNNFIQYLKFKESDNSTFSSNRDILIPERDPVLQVIGILDVAPFSGEIDDTLYGAI